MTKQHKKWGIVALVVYGLLMLWLLFGQRWGNWARQWNLQLFDTVRRYLWVLRYSGSPALIRHAVINLAGNVIMFVPLGFLTPVAFPKLRRFLWHFAYMVLTILVVECLQLLTMLGSCDVDDLLLNAVGTTIGFALFRLSSKYLCKGGA